ncbi:reticulon-1 isoform X1 [Lissotriton helveticus]
MSGEEPLGSGARWYSAGEEEARAALAGLTGSSEQAATGAGSHRSPGIWDQPPPLHPGKDEEGQRYPGNWDQERRPPAVTMETASTGHKPASQFGDYSFTKGLEPEEEDLYTSLKSDDSSSWSKDSKENPTYFSGILQQEHSSASPPVPAKDFSIGVHSPQDFSIFESRGLFTSDSGIEMTPAETTDVDKILSGSTDQEKVEAYKYMDIRGSEDISDVQDLTSGGRNTSAINTGSEPMRKLEHISEKSVLENANKTQYQNISEDIKFTPYMNEAFDAPGLHSTSVVKENKAIPVTITLTETENTDDSDLEDASPTKQDMILMPGPDVVPTVTVSEPEDESPGSLTPSSTGTEPSGSENINKYSLSEDELVSAIKAKDGAKGFSFKTSEDQQPSNTYAETHEIKNPPGIPGVHLPIENEPNSADSGDSEIEVVSEDQVTSEEALHSTYMTFSHMGGPPPSPASSSIQYSILREEREAELDSELIIESYEGSSASEESPKREQDSPLMKPFHMDIIEEENGLRNEGADAADYDLNSLTESKMNRENLAESASYMKSSFATSEVKIEPPHSKISSELSKDKLSLQKPTEGSVVKQSTASSKDSDKKSPVVLPTLIFFNKKKAVDLLYWRDIKQTGIVFGSVLLMLFSLTQFSVVSVIAYLALAALSATISFRIYKSVLQAVQKTDEGHPFKPYLEMEISLSQDQIQKYTDCLQLYMNSTVKELRRLFLVQDLVDSLKFAVLMWLLTYVGALFNGLTLLIMAVISMFSLPAVYDKYQPQIDQYVGLMKTHVNAVVTKIQAKIPGTKRKAE